MLELAAPRTTGVHQCLVTPEHTRAAREDSLGPDALVATERGVLLETEGAIAERVQEHRDHGASDVCVKYSLTARGICHSDN